MCLEGKLKEQTELISWTVMWRQKTLWKMNFWSRSMHPINVSTWTQCIKNWVFPLFNGQVMPAKANNYTATLSFCFMNVQSPFTVHWMVQWTETFYISEDCPVRHDKPYCHKFCASKNAYPWEANTHAFTVKEHIKNPQTNSRTD